MAEPERWEADSLPSTFHSNEKTATFGSPTDSSPGQSTFAAAPAVAIMDMNDTPEKGHIDDDSGELLEEYEEESPNPGQAQAPTKGVWK